MSTFDIQSIAPEGYEIIGYRTAKFGEEYMSGELVQRWGFDQPSSAKKLILRKKWAPKVGEVVACRDNEGVLWQFGIFLEMKGSIFICSRCTGDEGVFHWDECRQLTPQERGE